MSAVEALRRVVHRLFDDLWNGHDLDVIPELYSDQFVADYRPYAPLRRGHDGVPSHGSRAPSPTFTDYHEELIGLCAAGDVVAVHHRISGLQTGHWGSLPPTGRRLEFEEMMWLTFHDDGRVVHQRGVVDKLLGLRQAGIIPGPSENVAQ